MQLQYLALDNRMSTCMQSQGRAPAKFVELDFPEVTKKKAACIANTPVLWQLLGQDRPATTDVGAWLLQKRCFPGIERHIVRALRRRENKEQAPLGCRRTMLP